MVTTPDAATQLARIHRARARLVLNQTFFAHLALLLKLEAKICGTMATDGRSIFFDPSWCAQKTDEELFAVVAHEALHCALCHPMRKEWRNHKLFNIAADLAINPILRSAGFELQSEAIFDDRFPTGTAMETIYRTLAAEMPPRLPNNEPGDGDESDDGEQGQDQPGKGRGSKDDKPGDGQGSASVGDFGGMGEVIASAAEDGTPASKADLDDLERKWRTATYQAAQVAKMQGHCPGAIQEIIDTMRAAKVDWRSYLRDWLRTKSADDYSWQRPNPRHVGNGDYFPSLYTESCGPLLWITDTSGSVSHEELEQVCGELNDVLPSVKPEFVDVLYVDTRVAHAERFGPNDWPVKLNVHGRGGTCLAGAWDYAREHDITPIGAIVTTDLELNQCDLGADPGFPVLILSTGRDSPADGPLLFGDLVKVEVE